MTLENNSDPSRMETSPEDPLDGPCLPVSDDTLDELVDPTSSWASELTPIHEVSGPFRGRSALRGTLSPDLALAPDVLRLASAMGGLVCCRFERCLESFELYLRDDTVLLARQGSSLEGIFFETSRVEVLREVLEWKAGEFEVLSCLTIPVWLATEREAIPLQRLLIQSLIGVGDTPVEAVK